jgi:8-oxo-dGTP pyrophosphatase MutT (NUDIX family)
MSSEFEEIGSRAVWDGHIGSLRVGKFRHEDGEEVEREIFAHPGAVAVVVHDGEQLFLVRQPREPVGVPDLLELPAGKLDEDGESPLQTARRELAEEIGKAADDWEHLVTYYSSPGFTDEQVHVYLATGLSDVEQPETGEDERIEIVTWPLADLDGLIDAVQDGKTLIGLLKVRRRFKRINGA